MESPDLLARSTGGAANHKAPTSRRTPDPAPNWDSLESGDLLPLGRMFSPLVIAPLLSILLKKTCYPSGQPEGWTPNARNLEETERSVSTL